jgi:Regulator of Vps4 activity in the MVB pathway.
LHLKKLEFLDVAIVEISLASVINEDIHVELLELLELYCELLLARFGLLDQKWVRDYTALVPLANNSVPENRIQVSMKGCAVSYTPHRGQNLKVFCIPIYCEPWGLRHVIPFTSGHIELHVLRDILMHKFGRDFSAAVMENRDGCVTDRVSQKATRYLS